MGRQFGWAALGAAAVLACAGQANATVVDVAISAEFYSLTGPAGFYPAAPPCNAQSTYCTGTVNGRESVVFFIGGIPFTANFAFDTGLGVLTTTATSQTLNWNSAMGTASPLLSGNFLFGLSNPPLVDLDLTTATSFQAQRNNLGFFFTISSPDFTFQQGFPTTTDLAAARLDVPGPTGICLCSTLSYHDGDYDTNFSELFSETITPRAVPEPSTWAMLILGFAGIGAALRRRLSPAQA